MPRNLNTQSGHERRWEHLCLLRPDDICTSSTPQASCCGSRVQKAGQYSHLEDLWRYKAILCALPRCIFTTAGT